MKKAATLALTLAAVFSSGAFSADNAAAAGGKRILVAYFSHSGNTKEIASQIYKNTDSDLFEIVTIKPYPDNYNARVDQASKEQAESARPELASHVQNMDSYDTVFIGYPNWWGTMPMAVFTFLYEYDFSGKTIIPFCTHEGSRLGHSAADIATAAPAAVLSEGLAVRGSDAKNAQKTVTEWLKKIGITK